MQPMVEWNMLEILLEMNKTARLDFQKGSALDKAPFRC